MMMCYICMYAYEHISILMVSLIEVGGMYHGFHSPFQVERGKKKKRIKRKKKEKKPCR